MPKKKVTKAASKLSFQQEFYSDLSTANMYHGIIIRSPIKKGIITSISHPDLPADYFLFTAKDVPGRNLIDTPHGKVPVFSEGNVSYFGEPIGILTGPDEKVLNELLEEVEIVYDRNSIDYYFKIDDVKNDFPEEKDSEKSSEKTSAKNETPQEDTELEKLFSSEIASRSIKWGDFENINSIFEESDFCAEGSWKYSLSVPNFGETNGALCSFKENVLTVFTPTQWLRSLRQILSEALKIKSENIIVKKTRCFNHGTNSIWFNSIITCQAAIASLKTGHSVKIVYSRKEQNLFMDTMQPIVLNYKTSCTKEGKITALKADIKVDAGFINPFSQEIIDRLIIASCGCYSIENIQVTAVAERSFNPPSSIDLSLIDSAAFFAIENQITLLSKKCSVSPLELREKNFILPPGNKKTEQQKSLFTFKFEKPLEVLECAASLSDFKRKFFCYQQEASLRNHENFRKGMLTTYTSPLRGIGFACAYEGSCYFGSQAYGNDQSLEVTLEEDETVTIHTSPVSSSIQDIWSKLAGEILEISPANVKFNSNFLADKEPLLPESVYSNISVMTELLQKCCKGIKQRKSSAALPYSVVKKITPAQKKVWNSKEFKGQPFYNTSFIAATVEVEMDMATYRETIRNISIAISGGKLMNTQAVTSTIKLGIQKVLKSLVHHETLDAKDIKISFIQSNENPSQIGELVYQVIPSAYAQAISQAINCSLTSLPLSTDSIYNTLVEASQKEIKLEQETEESKDENSGNTEQ